MIKNIFSALVLDLISDGDWEIKNNENPYSTSARKVVTVGDMETHHKLVSMKGENFDEKI